MLHLVKSSKPLDQVVKNLEAAVTRNKFGVLGVHDLKAKMAEKGVPFARNGQSVLRRDRRRVTFQFVQRPAPREEIERVAEEIRAHLPGRRRAPRATRRDG